MKMTFNEFYDLYDCNFPYHDIPKAKKLIKLGCNISPRAGFMVAYELAHVPYGTKVSKRVLDEYLSILYVHLKHPLKEEVLGIVRKSFKCMNPMTVNEAVKLMYKIKAYKNQSHALCTIYMACDDKRGKADKLYDEIMEYWRKGAVLSCRT